MSVNPGSFRDPAGQVFTVNDEVYRFIFAAGVADFEAAREAGIYQQLIEAQLLTPYRETKVDESAPEGAKYCLKHPRLPMISYPWEWPFSMLKEAGLIQLSIMEKIIPAGFWLRDASAFNVQFDGDRLIFIDTLSIGRRVPESPWVGYGQFCSHFLAPLTMAACCDIRMLSLWRNYINGYPLDLARKVVPWWTMLKPGLFMHLFLHSFMQGVADGSHKISSVASTKKLKVSDRGLLGTIRSLRRTVEAIKWKRESNSWVDYDTIRTYKKQDVSRKSEFVDRIVSRLKPKIVWDLGANTGEFSLIAASHGPLVISIDGDPACTESLYQRLSEKGQRKRVLPLTVNLANPSPGLGWDNIERSSLLDRAPADLVLALAIVHHLVFSNSIPLHMIAQWLAKLAEYLIVEFVPSTDPMLQKLLMNRQGQHLPYDEEVFQKAFDQFFKIKEQLTLDNRRTLFFLARAEK